MVKVCFVVTELATQVFSIPWGPLRGTTTRSSRVIKTRYLVQIQPICLTFILNNLGIFQAYLDGATE